MATKNLLYVQSPGLSAVLNVSACAVIETAGAHKNIGKVFAAENGIDGLLRENLIDTSKESAKTIEALKYAPGGAFGFSSRNLDDLRECRAEFVQIVNVCEAHNIQFLLLNGGRNAADICLNISQVDVGCLRNPFYDSEWVISCDVARRSGSTYESDHSWQSGRPVA